MTRRILGPFVLVALAVGLGCAESATSTRPPEIVEIGTRATAPAPPASAAPAAPTALAEVSDAGPGEPAEPAPDLGPVWAATGQVDPTLRYDAQIATARAHRAAVDRAIGSRPDAGDLRAFFAQNQRLVERANAAYALAARTSDRTDEGRVLAIAEAADLLARWSLALEVADLGTLPRAWRADPSLHLTFEDVAQGPSKRWRAEAATLARHCMDLARRARVSSSEVDRCRGLDLRLGRVTRPAAGAADAGAACACDPLDPLCSASLGPWCRGGH